MDIRELNKTLSSTPASKKVLILVLFILIFSLMGYYYVFKPRQTKIEIFQAELTKLQETLNENLEVTKGIKDIEEELEKIKKRLIEVQAQLPTEKEIPSLLTKISDMGSMVGLEFLLFQPKPEVPRDFYNDVPIDIIIKGSYHIVAQFFDLVANLPRIVNINDISMKKPELEGDTVILETSCQAITFRFTAKTSGDAQS
ncbi:type 4a pilus biogenesis protein PilO [bacterium]|nr:type 4a pilus biogenesis protein PilO [bacterium]